MFYIEVMTLVLEEWQQLKSPEGKTVSPALPVLFHVAGRFPLEPDDYVEGTTMRVDRYWDSRRGWQPCVMVELGERF